MAKTKTPALSTDALKPYVQRAMTDPELREDLLAAFVAARSLYGQMAKSSGVKGKAEKVSEKDFQKQLQFLVADLSEASDKLKGKAKKKGHKARNRVILLTGVTLGVLYNPWTGEQTREWIMDRVAGGDGAGLEELRSRARGSVGVGRRRQRRRAVAASAIGIRVRAGPGRFLSTDSAPSRARRGRGRSSPRCHSPRGGRRLAGAASSSPARSE